MSVQDNVKLLQQLKFGFKRTINWNKYQLTVVIQNKKPHLDFEFDPSFQGVSRRFVLLLENNDDRKTNTKYFLPKAKIKDYNVIVNGRDFLDQPVKNDTFNT